MTILLDIDGVMVPEASWKVPEFEDDGFPRFSDQAVAALKSLLTGNTTIVLTTSHRFRYSVSEWREMFRKRGLTFGLLLRLDLPEEGMGRLDGIVRWAETREDDYFLIIDDDKQLNRMSEFLKGHLVLTSPLVGLVPEDIYKDR